jgi:polysaccharide pyruvyl transferase WcaK-like protein
MKLVITGYYDKQNYGDELFKEIASTIFKQCNKSKYNISFIPIYNLIKNKDIIDKDIIDCDNVILFGGETLNNYFLDTLIQFKKLNVNPTFKMSAIGVSCNQDYNTIINKIQIFEYISFRCMKDYNFLKTYIDSTYCPDIVMLLKPYNIHANSYKRFFPRLFNNTSNANTKCVGFFLSQTAIANKDEMYKKEYIKNILIFINYLLKKGYNIKLFSMCINDLKSESDIIINSQIYNSINDKGKSRVKLYTSVDDIMKNMVTINYAICWRFHAHILSIIHNVPFISLSTTPKVNNLLLDNNLQDVYVETDSNKLIEKFTYLVNKKVYYKDKIKQIYVQCHLQAKTYRDLNIYFKQRTQPTFYISNERMLDIFNRLCQEFKDSNLIDPADKTMFILFFLMRSIKNEYSYGLQEKITERNITDVTVLKDDIMWVINDCILKKNLMFYEAVSKQVVIKNNNKLVKYNFNYIDQDNYKNLHRAGWSYVFENLLKYNNSSDHTILCDLYVDRTFHWNCNEYAKLKVIPYTKPWIGFIHHTCEVEYTNYNTTALFQNKYFIESLPQCKGLIVLSLSLKQEIEKLLLAKNVKVYNLTHPTEFTDTLFNMKAFLSNKERKLVQIGAWLRVLDAINNIDLKDNTLALTKCVLKCKNMNVYYHKSIAHANNDESSISEASISEPSISEPSISEPNISRDTKSQSRLTCLDVDVKILENLSNVEYDKLLEQNIVFINLINASAVNTLIECIVRNTPIIVNRLPATIEMLGKDYPLFYNKIEEVTNLLDVNTIKKGWNYLKKIDKKKFTIKKFINDFLHI